MKHNNIRDRFSKLIVQHQKNSFEEFLISTLKYNVPKIFLENLTI